MTRCRAISSWAPLMALLSSQSALAGISAEPEAPAYALVVANNTAVGDTLEPLRYADDDGLRYYELFASYAENAKLLTVLDHDTQRRHRGAAQRARPPTRKNLRAALDSMFASMREDRQAGRSPTFYFIFAGHGELGDNQTGYVHLQDGRFSRAELFSEVIAASPARYNHIIIDACNAYFMVNRRGDWKPDRVSLSQPESSLADGFKSEQIAEYPNTGVLLSTSKAKQTHEWSVYEAGIFSHQLRSGMIGSADVNADGRIEYSEIAAYVAAANSAVNNPKAKVELYARPPSSNLAAPLFNVNRVKQNTAGVVHLSANTSGRYSLEDARGVRYADFHKAPGVPVDIVLLEQPFYYLRTRARELRVDPPGNFSVQAGSWRPIAMAARGSVAETFRRDLYKVPFGPEFYSGFVASTDLLAVAPYEPTSRLSDTAPKPARAWLPAARWSTLGVSAAAGIGSGIAAWLTRASYAGFKDQLQTRGTVNASLQQRVDRGRVATNALLGVTAAAGVSSLVLWLLDTPAPASSNAAQSGVQPALGIAPGSITATLSY